MSRTKRIMSMAMAILAFFMLVGSPFQQTTNAIAVTGGSLIAIIIAALAAMGITFVTTGSFSSTAEYVSSLMQEFASVNNTTVDSQLAGIQTGTSKLGKIIVNNRFLVYVQALGSFIKSKLSLANNAIKTVVSPGHSISDLECYAVPFNYPYELSVNGIHIGSSSGSQKYVIFAVADNNLICFVFSNSDGKIFWYRVGGNGGSVGGYNYKDLYRQNGSHFSYNTFSISAPIPAMQGYTVYTYESVLEAVKNSTTVDTSGVRIDINTDNMVLPLDDPDYSEGDGAIIDVGAEWGESYTDVVEGDIPRDFSDGKQGQATITYENADTASDQVEDTPSQSISQEVNDYQSPGLQSVFPFCIPFDIYAFFECLAADPVAPSFTWRFYVPGICDEEIELDLSEFDTVAQIVRTMELLAFIVGLALVTRDKFLRG